MRLSGCPIGTKKPALRRDVLLLDAFALARRTLDQVDLATGYTGPVAAVAALNLFHCVAYVVRAMPPMRLVEIRQDQTPPKTESLVHS